MLNRKNPPAFVQSKSFDLLTPEIQNLSNGSKLIAIHGGEQDVVKIELIFKAGKWFEPFPGLSYFTGTLLSKGTSKHTSFQITNVLDFYGAHLEIHPGFDFTSVTLYALSKNVPHVIDILVEIISEATFPELEIQQAKDIYEQGLKINLEKTSYLASKEFRKNLFGINHPYGYDVEFSDVENIKQENLLDFRNSNFLDFTVFAAGKISDEIKILIAEKLEQLKVKGANAVSHRKSGSGTYNHFICKKDSVQTSLRTGKSTISRSHPDYAGLLLTNHLLGGFFGSRLMKNIREEKGLTYGIQSSIHALKQDCYFVIVADVNNENRELTISEIRNELSRLRNQPIPEEELAVARNHFIGSLQTEMSTPFAHMDKIKLITLFNLPGTFYAHLVDSLFGITAIDINQFANKYFSEDQLLTIAVGEK